MAQCETSACPKHMNEIHEQFTTAKSAARDAEAAIGPAALTQSADDFRPTELDAAVSSCAAEMDDVADAHLYMQVGDEGRTLTLDGSTSTEQSVRTGECLLAALDAPASVVSKVESTTAMMGRQTDSWDDLTLTWSYHPDSGFEAVFESASSR